MNHVLPLYQIAGWNANFENAKSRTYNKPQFVCVPNKHGGTGLSNIQGEVNGAEIYGIWMWIVQLCSRQPPQRDGWLTDNGKKDGRRLSARELSILFRCEREKIVRALMVLQSPEVSWMRLVDGQPEHLTGQQADTAVSVEGQGTGTNEAPSAPPHIPDPSDTARIPDGYQNNLSEVTERKKERSLPPIVPQGGTGENLDCQQAQTWLNKLFGRQKAWSAKEMHALSEVLPISAEDQALVDWLHGLERDGEGWAICPFDNAKLTKPKQSLSALIENFGEEIDKARAARKQCGLNGVLEHKKSAAAEPDDDGWTADRRAAFYAIYGDDREFPARFRDLGASEQRKIGDAITEKQKIEAAAQ